LSPKGDLLRVTTYGLQQARACLPQEVLPEMPGLNSGTITGAPVTVYWVQGTVRCEALRMYSPQWNPAALHQPAVLCRPGPGLLLPCHRFCTFIY